MKLFSTVRTVGMVATTSIILTFVPVLPISLPEALSILVSSLFHHLNEALQNFVFL